MVGRQSVTHSTLKREMRSNRCHRARASRWRFQWFSEALTSRGPEGGLEEPNPMGGDDKSNAQACRLSFNSILLVARRRTPKWHPG